ncbi:MAG: hypothetical protein KatS3mg012_2230 [Gaiellaceae bacterium]|jgi:predicted nucleotidyltransferase|nr:MAG: hypothetical protein KatS3mg012_2230 [Gaiellaceae bacterium]
MATLLDTSLTEVERRVLERVVALLEAAYGDDLRSVWLFGSRARGEEPAPDSDVDLLVVVRDATLDDHFRIGRLVDEAAEAEGANPAFFSIHVYTPARIEERRAIRSFFMEEVDRDKVVLAGEP